MLNSHTAMYLQIKSFRKIVYFRSMSSGLDALHDSAVTLEVDEQCFNGTLKVLRLSPKSVTIAEFCPFPDGFSADEMLNARVSDSMTKFTSGCESVHASLSHVESTVEFFGDFSAFRIDEDYTVEVLIDSESMGLFSAYEPKIFGGARHVNIDWFPNNLLSNLSNELEKGRSVCLAKAPTSQP